MDDGFEKVQAKYDYPAAEGSTQELSMTRGEVLTLLDDSKTWWKVKNKKNEIGYVPSNYIIRAVKKTKHKKQALAQPPKEPQYDAQAQVMGKFCVALYNYDKTRDDELQLFKGQNILILEESEDDWWRGKNVATGHDGWFPSNYVEVVQGNDQSQETQESDVSVLSGYNDSSPVIENVRCLYDFEAKSPEELSFRESDELHILGKVIDDPEWWVGRDREGKIGLVPRIYTEVVENTTKVTTAPIGVHEVPEPSGRYVEMSQKPWFFERCETRDMAENDLRFANEGDFIVRPSESSRGDGALSISVKGKAKNKHFKILRQDDEFVIGQRKFKSVDELIRNYIKNPIFSSGEEKLFLVRHCLNHK